MNTIKPYHFSSGTDSMFQFFTNSIDMAYMGISPFLLGKHYGLPLKIVGIAQEFQTSHGIVLRNEHMPSTGYLKLGTIAGSTAHCLGAEWAEQQDSEVVFVNLSPAEQIKAYEYGLIDGIAGWEPALTVAEQLNGKRVFTANDSLAKGYNLLVASETSLAEKGNLVKSFLIAHNDACQLINSEDINNTLDYIKTVFDKDIKNSQYKNILRNSYVWPNCPKGLSSENIQDISHSLIHSWEFLKKVKLIANQDLIVKSCFAENKFESNKQETELRVGYSESLMCASYYVAEGLQLFEKNGLKVDTSERRFIERLAKLSINDRKDLSIIKSHIETDPASAVIKAGIINERMFNTLYEKIKGKPANKVFSKTLAQLEADNAIPVLILSNVHWIRNMRNIAAHDIEEINASIALESYRKLVDILEWYPTALSQMEKQILNCYKCNYQLEKDWKVCPNCTSIIQNSCQHCKKELQPDWLTCPFCGKDK